MFKSAISLLTLGSFLYLQLVFDELMERQREKEEKEAKKRQRLADNFSDLLYSIKVFWCCFKLDRYARLY